MDDQGWVVSLFHLKKRDFSFSQSVSPANSKPGDRSAFARGLSSAGRIWTFETFDLSAKCIPSDECEVRALIALGFGLGLNLHDHNHVGHHTHLNI